MASSHKIMEVLTHDPSLGHITTFGGHPVNCAAALANLEVLTEGNLIEQVEEKGQLFEELLDHEQIREIRRIGLMIAVDLESENIVNKVISKCREQGVLLYWFLSIRNSFRIAPPLIISKEQIREACRVIMEVLDRVNFGE
jgi:acetylornithine/succinyldiaminopimelate/putrescine aminotransferase